MDELKSQIREFIRDSSHIEPIWVLDRLDVNDPIRAISHTSSVTALKP